MILMSISRKIFQMRVSFILIWLSAKGHSWGILMGVEDDHVEIKG
jgi:hypothetical protein